MAKNKPRNEYNTMPGYTRAERLQANHPNNEAAWNALEVGIDAATLSEFLREPTIAIAKNMGKRLKGLDAAGIRTEILTDNQVLSLVLRLAPVLILAERERVEREEEVHGKRGE